MEFIALSLIVFVVAFGCGYGVRELIARVPLHGARNIRTLSARFIADLQEHWEG